ncbi:MAG: hypothetical protein IT529_08885 [Burkholderiales bacterium]|nr:hypothetical protein [Burkholderiales bacterium]
MISVEELRQTPVEDQPVERPAVASAQVILHAGAALADVREGVEVLFRDEVAAIPALRARLARWELPVW